MSWAKLDDRYDDGAKVRRAWHAHPRAVGLHAMAITYCARNETNGHVDDLWLTEKLPVKREREQVLQALVDVGLFDRAEGGYSVHDYLDYNDSREALAERRRKDAERKGRQHPRGKRSDVAPESARTPSGFHPDSVRIPDASRGDGGAPAVPRPDPTRPTLPTEDARGARSSSKKEPDGFEGWLAYHGERSGRGVPKAGTTHRKTLAAHFAALVAEGFTLDDFRLASDGVLADEWKRSNGHDKFDTVLRKTKFGELVEDGRRARSGAGRTPGPNYGPIDLAARRRALGYDDEASA